ncbi:ParA family protein [Kitasatospora herbaricolor]|uniref:ParA family protein n=1 Tax=Kitasatospora herbaricolor TaxID=68217 RepID=A0ABZ1WM65_9ACTN|nr:ParA family protein [Kitasatospora herbaricolor]
MTTSLPSEQREKLLVNITPQLRRRLKVRAAECGMNVQDAAEHAVSRWYDAPAPEPVETSGAKSWGVLLPAGGPDKFATTCAAREVTKVQGFAQAIELWLSEHPSPARPLVAQPVQRILVANQKGGVGKTFVAGGVAQAAAESGKRVLLVDYDPQGHLTSRLGLEGLEDGEESLLTHMLGRGRRDLRELLTALDEERFGGRLHVLPACDDAFLLDAELAVLRHGRDTCLERALESVEQDYDLIVLDGPPSLGLGMDVALNYVRRRDGERTNRSGVLIPVWADQSSHRAYRMLNAQIETQLQINRVTIDQLGLVVNAYDSRRGITVTKNYDLWMERAERPAVRATFKDLKEGRESSDYCRPLLDYAPDSELSETMRDLALELTT